MLSPLKSTPKPISLILFRLLALILLSVSFSDIISVSRSVCHKHCSHYSILSLSDNRGSNNYNDNDGNDDGKDNNATVCASGRARAAATSVGVFGEARKMKVDSRSSLRVLDSSFGLGLGAWKV